MIEHSIFRLFLHEKGRNIQFLASPIRSASRVNLFFILLSLT